MLGMKKDQVAQLSAYKAYLAVAGRMGLKVKLTDPSAKIKRTMSLNMSKFGDVGVDCYSVFLDYKATLQSLMFN